MNVVAVSPSGDAEGLKPAPISAAGMDSPAAPVAVPKVPLNSSLRLLLDRMRVVSDNVLPTVVMLVLLLGLWQIVCSQPGASLPPPLKVFTDTQDLIMHPFFEGNGNEKGLG